MISCVSRRRVAAFCQPVCKPRFHARETCVGFAQLPALFLSWAARAQPLITASPAKTAKSKTESWRLTPILPEGKRPPKPQRPTASNPDLKPSREHILFPWEAEMTDIEWAVTTFLAKKHPE